MIIVAVMPSESQYRDLLRSMREISGRADVVFGKIQFLSDSLGQGGRG